MTNVLPVARENELTVSDIDNDPVIAGYVSDAQTIYTFDIKYLQSIYIADSAAIVLRFPRKVIDTGKCVYLDCNNRICVYSNDQQGTPYRFSIPGSQYFIDLPVYPYRRDYFISDHQCAPVLPNIMPPTAIGVKPISTTGASETPEPYEKSKRELQYDRYFTYENKIYSFFTDNKELAVHQFILTQAEEAKDNTTKVVRLAGNVERRFLVFDLGKLEREYEKIS